MPDPHLKITAGALPYSDGSGDQVKATAERTDEGIMLRFEMVHQIPLDDWKKAREMIDTVVYAAQNLAKAQ
jgi:hypothetical protein